MVTAAQKRALTKAEFAGEGSGVSPPKHSGNGIILPIVSGLAVIAAAGSAYYFDLIPIADVKKDVVQKKEKSKPEGNRVTEINFPLVDVINRPLQVVPSVEHTPAGHRVSVDHLNSVWYGYVRPPGDEQEKDQEPISVLKAKKEEDTLDISSTSSLAIAIEEFDCGSKKLTAQDLPSVVIPVNLDEGYLRDLDKLNETQLRVRIVQLASELGERTKWEALRLNEFLTRKEKEVADKYVEIMQKQRLEYENLLSRRLREQEDGLTQQSNARMQEKENSIQSLMEAAANTQNLEHSAEIDSITDRLQKEYNIKYEADYGAKLAEEKHTFVKELEEKVKVIEESVQRLHKLEQLLKISRNFEDGSQRAHRVSAAALALVEKMQSSTGAGKEFAALKSAASENAVIASALSQLPASTEDGVPTLSELQAKFDKVYIASRQALFVPEGEKGLEGQIAGILLATFTTPPQADLVSTRFPSDQMTTKTDHILSCTQRHVSLGDLENAVNELDKVKGQASFTVEDWKKSAIERISVDRALRAIKVECSIINANLGGKVSASS